MRCDQQDRRPAARISLGLVLLAVALAPRPAPAQSWDGSYAGEGKYNGPPGCLPSEYDAEAEITGDALRLRLTRGGKTEQTVALKIAGDGSIDRTFLCSPRAPASMRGPAHVHGRVGNGTIHLSITGAAANIGGGITLSLRTPPTVAGQPPGYAPPPQGYAPPGNAPQPGYVQPQPGYVQPQPAQPGYTQPQPGYVAPQPGYVRPPSPGYVPAPGTQPQPGQAGAAPQYAPQPPQGYYPPAPGNQPRTLPAQPPQPSGRQLGAAQPTAPARQQAAPASPTLSRPAETEPAFDADERRLVQESLQILGHYGGAIDGLFGPGTRSAIAAYQRSIDEPPSGYLTPRQLLALNADARAKAREQLAAKRDEPKPPAAPAAKTADSDKASPHFEPAKPAAADPYELAFWDAIKSSDNPDDYKAYLDAYPDGRFVALARVRATRKPSDDALPATGSDTDTAAVVPDIDYGNYHALVIGNDDYAKLPKLKTAAADARSVADLLREDYGFEVTLLTDATRYDILSELASLRTHLGENDNLLIYYAGHGLLDRATNAGFWLPVDAEAETPANWIANEDLTRSIRAMQAKHVLVVADSCFAGALVRAAPANFASAPERSAWLERMARKRARTVLSSGGLEPVLDSGDGSGHSVFAEAFLAALRENTGVLEGQTLFRQVSRPVVVNADQTPEYSDMRNAGHDGGDFLFVRR